MKVDDPNSYSYGEYEDWMSSGPENMWNYGAEIWCNMEGQYTTIAADLSILSGSYNMPICSLGVMGTEYVRNSEIPSSLELGKDETKTLDVEKIYSVHTIGNELDIILRQAAKEELSWVAIT